MKKTFIITDLCCANCARKMEDAIGKLPGVTSVGINFLTQKMTLEGDDDRFDAILREADKCIRRIEPDCRPKV